MIIMMMTMVMPWSREINHNGPISVIFNWRLDSSATEVHVEIESDWIHSKSNLAALKRQDIYPGKMYQL